MSNRTYMWLILTELLMIILMFYIMSQVSSLASSIILIPSSMLLMVLMGMETLLSGMLIMMFTMVFIGGLMVLLVSVTSMIYQEQWVTLSPLSMISVIFFILLMKKEAYEWEESTSIFLAWFEGLNKVTLLVLTLTTLVVSLLTISIFLMGFKGMIRSM